MGDEDDSAAREEGATEKVLEQSSSGVTVLRGL